MVFILSRFELSIKIILIFICLIDFIIIIYCYYHFILLIFFRLLFKYSYRLFSQNKKPKIVIIIIIIIIITGSNSTKYLFLCYRTLYTTDEFFEFIVKLYKKYEVAKRNKMDSICRFYSFFVQWIIYWAPLDFNSHLKTKMINFWLNINDTTKKYQKVIAQMIVHFNLLLNQKQKGKNRIVYHKPGSQPEIKRKPKKATHIKSPRDLFAQFSNLSLNAIISPRETLLHSSSGNNMHININNNNNNNNSYNHSGSTPRKITNLFSIKVKELAEQLTLMEAQLFSQIQLTEFLDKNWQKDTKFKVARTLSTLTHNFNNVRLFN